MFIFYYLEVAVYNICVNVFRFLLCILYYTNLLTPIDNKLITNYDYVIVGSGTAGSLIAHRIAAETNYSYILLEAGGKSNFMFNIPVIGPLLQGSPYDWQFTTIKQNNACFAMMNQKCLLPQGKLTGGSAKLNNMIHIRGNLTHYVEWFHGKHDLNYIQKQFDFIEENILYVEDIKYESLLTQPILDAAKELGYNNFDIYKKFSSGFMKSRVNQHNGKRWATSEKIDETINFLNNAHVMKILINDKRKAYGVQFKISDKKHEIYASKGIIISAGTINTPKILLLSGIGPVHTLNKLKIPLIKESPVGENLQDHVTTGLDLITFNKSLNIGASDLLNPLNALQYFLNGQGPLTSPGCEVVGFVSTKNESFNTPDLQFMVLPVGIASDLGSHLRKTIGIKDHVWTSYFSKTYGKYTASIVPILLHPKSTGVVTLQNNNPDMPPLVNPKYLSVKEDVKMLIKGLKIVQKLIKTESMKKLGAELNTNSFPGCENLILFTDEYWECYIRHLTLTSFHPVGTCKMGLPSSEDSVVDTSFNVIGISNLFVADGSVLPTLPSGNINAAIAMMANVFFETNIVQIYFKKKEVNRDINACYYRDYVLCSYFYVCT